MRSLASTAALDRLKRLHPRVIDLSLGRIERLLSALGHPERRLPPVIHVAGTNGKGSVVAFLHALTEAHGGRAHVYTSPHLVRFHERIVVGGGEIEEGALTALLEECEAANANQPITFFEITTAAALLAFARASADVTLLETGLGGRLDATNVVPRPVMTILTPIGLDHQHYLGETLAAIAREKAGILKPGVPCVCAAQPAEASGVIRERARELAAPLLRQGVDWRVAASEGGVTFEAVQEGLARAVAAAAGEAAARRLRLPPPALAGAHQVANAGVALAAFLAIAGEVLGVTPDAGTLRRGLTAARWPARLQRLTDGVLVRRLPMGWELWLDGGHNPAAAVALAAHARQNWRDRPLSLVFGMLRSKDSAGFLAPWRGVVEEVRTVPIAGEAASLSAADSALTASAAGLTAEASDDIPAALAALARGASQPKRVLICGSLYLAGQVLAANAGLGSA